MKTTSVGIQFVQEDMESNIQASRPRLGFPLATALLFTFVTAGCTTTRFPENPEDHRLFHELQAAGHEYYFNVRAGVASRVLGILPESEARATIDEIKERWAEIDRLDAADDVSEYMNAHGLTTVGERIRETLLQNQPDEPPDGVDERLEAAAVKQGLIDAAFELKPTG